MTFFEYLYYFGYAAKKHHSLKNRKRLPCPVISIGNLTLGGTGKTPAAMALARKAAGIGFQPCILTRGYKGKAHGPCFVSKGDGPLLDADQAGDEAVLMAEQLPGIPIIKAKRRYEGGMFALETLQPPVPVPRAQWLFILDDGFQHWVLHRDKDILLIDGSDPFGNRKLFPFGKLREPLNAMQRADIIVITNAVSYEGIDNHEADMESLTRDVKRYAPSVPVFFARHLPTAFITPSVNALNLSDMKDKKVFAFCGIGNPHSFKNTLLSVAGELKGFMVFRDHHRYSNAEFRMIIDNAEKSGADWIVTTEKDIMRLKGFPLPGNLLALCIEFHVDDEFYKDAFDLRR